MTVTIATTGWNISETIIPLIRYYIDICKFDKFLYFDNYSTDDTIEKIKSVYGNDSRVVIGHTPYIGHVATEEVCLMNDNLKIDTNDVFIWIDSDEVLYCKDFQQHFKNLKEKNQYYSATPMTNVYNKYDIFDESKHNILSNFDVGYTNPVFKVPVIIKSPDNNITFGGGHHSVNIGDQVIEDKEGDLSFGDEGFHLFHFTFINCEMYYKRKTLCRTRNLELGIDHSWYHNYWNLSLDTIQGMINQQKIDGKPIAEYV